MPRVALLAILALAACGGSGGGGDMTPDRVTQAAELDAAVAATGISRPRGLPTSGTARYDGYLTARLPIASGGARREYLGDVTLTMDFGADRNPLTGRAEKFSAASGDTLGGVLRLGDSALFRKTDPDRNFTFSADLDGKLEKGSDSFDIDATLEGEFRGRNESAVSGAVYGDITGPSGVDIFDGEFSAGR